MTNKKAQFNRLAEHFLTSRHETPSNLVVLLDAVLSVPDDLIPDQPSLRDEAHMAANIVLGSFNHFKADPLKDYLIDWMNTNYREDWEEVCSRSGGRYLNA